MGIFGKTLLIAAVCVPLLSAPEHCASAATAAEEAPGTSAVAWQLSLELAKTKASSGNTAEASRHLLDAIDHGFYDFYTLNYDDSLSPLRVTPDWPKIVLAFEEKNPWARSLALLFDGSKDGWDRYRAAHAYLQTRPTIPREFIKTYRELYSTSATFVGEYVEASRYYGRVGTASRPLDAGHAIASSAIEPIVKASMGARAVLLNESHGRSNTRAANLLLVSELVQHGFTHLALEALAVEKNSTGCGTAVTSDIDFDSRGYPLKTSGAYLNDPIFAELVRVAISSGLKVVGYDYQFDSPTIEEREEAQAENLACLLRSDAKAKIIVIGGFAHISEREDFHVPGGMMGARLKRITGIDPVTVDSTQLLTLDETRIKAGLPGQPVGGPLLLLNADGDPWTSEGYDFTVFVPSARPRADAEPSWLALGGRRQRLEPAVPECDALGGCMLEARLAGEAADAVAVDRCVFKSGQIGCALYVPSGKVRVQMYGDSDPLDVGVFSIGVEGSIGE